METDILTNQTPTGESFDLVCFSHLRWDFVYQRPQHLLSRFAKTSRVFFIEEPVFHDGEAEFKVSPRGDNLYVVVPHVPHDSDRQTLDDLLRDLLNKFTANYKIQNFAAWYYTPMMLAWSDHLEPQATVYDCMDELSAFKFAPPELLENEAELFLKADLVFTGGQSLYEAKKERHKSVHAFPSSIDAAHFKQARNLTEPPDQESIAAPKFGYYGVIDERIDIRLLAEMADLRPDWQIVMIGPVVKIADEDLPRRANIHYLGGRDYQQLPAYLAGWDVAIMPFAINDSTRFISPTKTPEYLAAGKPVISTAIRDVVRPYGAMNLVHIAATAEEFVASCERALQEDTTARLGRVDEFLTGISWDKTWSEMNDLIDEVVRKQYKSLTA